MAGRVVVALPLLLLPSLLAIHTPWELVGPHGRVGAALRSTDDAASVACLTRATLAERLGGGRASPARACRPIVVATGAESWHAISELARARDCERDLVFVGNGPLAWTPVAATRVLLYARATADGRLISTEPAPPSRAIGPHAEWIAARLRERHGVECVVETEPASFRRHAAAKLAWACVMWLACAQLDAPCEHAADDPLVGQLLTELVPWLWSTEVSPSSASATLAEDETPEVGAAARAERESEAEFGEFVLTEMARYSRSLSGVRPSVSLARSELDARNGWVCKCARERLGDEGWRRAMPLHLRLLRAHGEYDGFRLR
jgi:hypothetical protein